MSPADLTRAQAEAVARRLDPRGDQAVVFSRDGVVLHTEPERVDAVRRHGWVYLAQREDDVVRVVRLGPEGPDDDRAWR